MVKSIPLAALAIPLQEEADLRWFLSGEYRGDCGVKSTLGPQIEAARLGRKRLERAMHLDWFPDESSPQLQAIRRLRRVESRWARVPQQHRTVLQAVFGEPNQAHRYLLRAFTSPDTGLWLGLIVLGCPEAARAHARSRSRRTLFDWICRLSERLANKDQSGGKHQERRDRELADLLITASERRVRTAISSYSGVAAPNP